MRTITVFYDNSGYTLRWLRALVWCYSEFKDQGFKISFEGLETPIPYMSRFCHVPTTKQDFHKLFSKKDYDIVFLAYHHSKKSLCQLTSEERAEVLTSLRKKSNKLIWLDTADGTGTCYFDVLPYVDKYLKKQVLRDLKQYDHEVWSNRVFGEYYHNMLGINETGQKETNNYYSVLKPEYYSKIGISWNVGIGDLHSSGIKRFLYRRAYAPVRFEAPSLNKRFDIHYRGSAYPGAIGYQRALTMDMLLKRTDIRKPDVNTRVPYDEYVKESRDSLALISPFGFGEICGRDFEAFLFGAALIKPDMSHLRTYPDVYKSDETYLSIDWNYANFNELMDLFLTETGRKRILEHLLFDKEMKEAFVKHVLSQIDLENNRLNSSENYTFE